MTLETELRAFLRVNPKRTFSTLELIEHLPAMKTRAGDIASRAPDLVARKETFVPVRGMFKGKTCHHYSWRDNPSVDNVVSAENPLQVRIERLERILRMMGHDL